VQAFSVICSSAASSAHEVHGLSLFPFICRSPTFLRTLLTFRKCLANNISIELYGKMLSKGAHLSGMLTDNEKHAITKAIRFRRSQVDGRAKSFVEQTIYKHDFSGLTTPPDSPLRPNKPGVVQAAKVQHAHVLFRSSSFDQLKTRVNGSGPESGGAAQQQIPTITTAPTWEPIIRERVERQWRPTLRTTTNNDKLLDHPGFLSASVDLTLTRPAKKLTPKPATIAKCSNARTTYNNPTSTATSEATPPSPSRHGSHSHSMPASPTRPEAAASRKARTRLTSHQSKSSKKPLKGKSKSKDANNPIKVAQPSANHPQPIHTILTTPSRPSKIPVRSPHLSFGKWLDSQSPSPEMLPNETLFAMYEIDHESATGNLTAPRDCIEDPLEPFEEQSELFEAIDQTTPVRRSLATKQNARSLQAVKRPLFADPFQASIAPPNTLREGQKTNRYGNSLKDDTELPRRIERLLKRQADVRLAAYERVLIMSTISSKDSSDLKPAHDVQTPDHTKTKAKHATKALESVSNVEAEQPSEASVTKSSTGVGSIGQYSGMHLPTKASTRWPHESVHEKSPPSISNKSKEGISRWNRFLSFSGKKKVVQNPKTMNTGPDAKQHSHTGPLPTDARTKPPSKLRRWLFGKGKNSDRYAATWI
jgi:hypothetical protein